MNHVLLPYEVDEPEYQDNDFEDRVKGKHFLMYFSGDSELSTTRMALVQVVLQAQPNCCPVAFVHATFRVLQLYVLGLLLTSPPAWSCS